MTCSEVLSRLDDLVDGELPADQAAQARDHIKACDSCRLEYNLALRVRRMLGSMISPDPGDEYFAEAESHILARTAVPNAAVETRRAEAANAPGDRRTQLLPALLSVAASLAILFIAIYLGSNEELRITRTIHATAPVLATAGVRSPAAENPVFTQEDRIRITRGMMLIGSPGILGRFSSLPEIVRTTAPDES